MPKIWLTLYIINNYIHILLKVRHFFGFFLKKKMLPLQKSKWFKNKKDKRVEIAFSGLEVNWKAYFLSLFIQSLISDLFTIALYPPHSLHIFTTRKEKNYGGAECGKWKENAAVWSSQLPVTLLLLLYRIAPFSQKPNGQLKM